MFHDVGFWVLVVGSTVGSVVGCWVGLIRCFYCYTNNCTILIKLIWNTEIVGWSLGAFEGWKVGMYVGMWVVSKSWLFKIRLRLVLKASDLYQHFINWWYTHDIVIADCCFSINNTRIGLICWFCCWYKTWLLCRCIQPKCITTLLWINPLRAWEIETHFSAGPGPQLLIRAKRGKFWFFVSFLERIACLKTILCFILTDKLNEFSKLKPQGSTSSTLKVQLWLAGKLKSQGSTLRW